MHRHTKYVLSFSNKIWMPSRAMNLYRMHDHRWFLNPVVWKFPVGHKDDRHLERKHTNVFKKIILRVVEMHLEISCSERSCRSGIKLWMFFRAYHRIFLLYLGCIGRRNLRLRLYTWRSRDMGLSCIHWDLKRECKVIQCYVENPIVSSYSTMIPSLGYRSPLSLSSPPLSMYSPVQCVPFPV